MLAQQRASLLSPAAAASPPRPPPGSSGAAAAAPPSASSRRPQPRCTGVCAAGARSALFVRASALWSAFGLFTTLVFGRSLYAVVQGALGILVSLEAFFSVSRGERAFLKWFAPYMVANTAASVVIGAVTLSGLDVECTGAPNRAGCTVTGLAYALVMILGGASIGLFAAINAAVALATMGEPRATAADTRVSL